MTSETARIFNSAIGASAIAATFEFGLFEELKANGTVDLEEFCDRRDLTCWSVTSVLQVLHCFDIVAISPDRKTARRGSLFAETYQDKGYFLWLMRGYGNLLHNLATIVKNGDCTLEGIGRDGKYIAMAGRDYGARFVDPHFTEMLGEEPYQVAADLGCGSAERLINLAKSHPTFRGVGVEVNKGAVDLARRSIKQAGLDDRVQVVHSDVKNLIAQPEFSEVEVLFCFFMGHDLWPRPNCLKALRSIRSAFPRVRRFLFCDTYRSDLPMPGDVPIFTLGFEFTHALMGQFIPSLAEWEDLFEESGWSCVGRRDISIPFSSIFDLRIGEGSGESPEVERN